MIVLDTTSMRGSYHDLLKQIMLEGQQRSPRGMATVEVCPALIRLGNPLDALPLGTGRGIVQALACVEALSLIAQEADPKLFIAASPHYAKFVDPGTGELEVAYGPRLLTQMEWAESRLRQDRDSRQAHVDLWHPRWEKPGLRAYPCVTSCGFAVRDGALDLFVEMRSNDAWLGLPYDMFMFTQLQASLAMALNVPVGRYHHYARSLHLYEHHWEKVGELVDDHRGVNWAPTYEGVSGDSWDECRDRARSILRGVAPSGGLTLSESAYLATMRGKVLPKVAGWTA